MTLKLYVVCVAQPKNSPIMGLRYGRAVPIKQATVHLHTQSAEKAMNGFISKLRSAGATPPRCRIIDYDRAKVLINR